MKKSFISIWSVIIVLLLIQIPSFGYGSDSPNELLFSRTHFEWILPRTTFGLDNNLLSYEFINLDMTDSAVKEDTLSLMKDGVFRFGTNTVADTKITIGRFALRFGNWETTNFSLGKGFQDLAFYGYDINKEYDFTKTGASGLSAMTFDVSYGHHLLNDDDLKLGVGITCHYLLGLAMFDAKVTDGTVTSDEVGQAVYNLQGEYYYTYPRFLNNIDTINFSMIDANTLVDAIQGQGFLFDVGSRYIQNRLMVDLVLRNIGPGIQWDNVAHAPASLNGDLTVGETGFNYDNYNFVLGDEEITTYTTKPPMVLDSNVSYRIFKGLVVNAGISKGFGDAWGVSSAPEYRAGMDCLLLGFLRFAGEASLQGKEIQIDTLGQLRLFFLWLTLEAGWNSPDASFDRATGFNVGLSTRLHF